MMIADVWSALRLKRVYREGNREAIPYEEAVRIIRGERARMFDPELLNLFLGNIQLKKGKRWVEQKFNLVTFFKILISW
jgi:response regulator RpfG family c-di-GMP phosphodiesterase